MVSEHSEIEMKALLNKMAEEHFGYGSWKAPFWFLGPEQGMSKDDRELVKRARTWLKRGSRDIDDCLEFHRDVEIIKWNFRLQLTWAKLMLVTMGYASEPVSLSERLEYQRKRWGTSDGNVSIIELSGLAAYSHSVPRDRKTFLPPRVSKLLLKIKEYEPEFVILYGKHESCSYAWKRLTEQPSASEVYRSSFAEIWKTNTTLLARTSHPRGTRNQDWIDLGNRLGALKERRHLDN